ncbi:colicin immunity domain-containing protein [Listeria ilorinensis]|uniref:colicin immunity domain-containing protein n=1 Tax=Listeria ilorinensis TaxID=2867439 RepID=UPI001EF546B7|nr:colicin immunity domain-containing protein [Listeria ilorinensis]
MTEKEQLYYLLRAFHSKKIDANTFTNHFVRIFDLEIDYEELSKKEYDILGNISDMAARFSDSLEDLELPNVYFSEKQIREEVNQALKSLT